MSSAPGEGDAAGAGVGVCTGWLSPSPEEESLSAPALLSCPSFPPEGESLSAPALLSCPSFSPEGGSLSVPGLSSCPSFSPEERSLSVPMLSSLPEDAALSFWFSLAAEISLCAGKSVCPREEERRGSVYSPDSCCRASVSAAVPGIWVGVGAGDDTGAGDGVEAGVPAGVGEGGTLPSSVGGRVGVAVGTSGTVLGVTAGLTEGSGECDGQGSKEASGSLSRKSSDTGFGEGRMARSVRFEKSDRSWPAFPMISWTARWAPSTESRRRSTCPVRLPEDADTSLLSWVSRL